MISVIRRTLLCPFGLHQRHSLGWLNTFCPDCRKLLRPDAFQPYLVTLKDGTAHKVQAVNERHARSLVIYGGVNRGRVDARTGRIVDPVVVHPSNIAHVHGAPGSPTGAPSRD